MGEVKVEAAKLASTVDKGPSRSQRQYFLLIRSAQASPELSA